MWTINITFIRGQYVEIVESTHLISWDWDAGNSNLSLGNNTMELDLQNDSVTTDPFIGDAQFNPVATP